MRGEPLVRGRADLGDPRPGHDIAEPGDGLEQADLPLPGHRRGGDPLVQVLYRGVQQLDLVQDQAAHLRVVIGEPAFQRHRQVRQLPGGAHPADRQICHPPCRGALRRSAPRSSPAPPLAGNVGGDRAELDADRLRLVQPLDLQVRAWTFLTRYRTRSRISFSSRGGMYDPCSRPHSSSRQPGAVLRVGLVPLQRLHVRRVDHQDLGEVLFAQRVVHRLGVDPAGLHHHVRHAPPRATPAPSACSTP